jgi:hypothetical protein
MDRGAAFMADVIVLNATRCLAVIHAKRSAQVFFGSTLDFAELDGNFNAAEEFRRG